MRKKHGNPSVRVVEKSPDIPVAVVQSTIRIFRWILQGELKGERRGLRIASSLCMCVCVCMCLCNINVCVNKQRPLSQTITHLTINRCVQVQGLEKNLLLILVTQELPCVRPNSWPLSVPGNVYLIVSKSSYFQRGDYVLPFTTKHLFLLIRI
jgi:hypothetical protein